METNALQASVRFFFFFTICIYSRALQKTFQIKPTECYFQVISAGFRDRLLPRGIKLHNINDNRLLCKPKIVTCLWKNGSLQTDDKLMNSPLIANLVIALCLHMWQDTVRIG